MLFTQMLAQTPPEIYAKYPGEMERIVMLECCTAFDRMKAILEEDCLDNLTRLRRIMEITKTMEAVFRNQTRKATCS